MEFKNVKIEDRDRIRVVYIQRDTPLNPLNIDTLKEIKEAVCSSGKKIPVITGSNRAFSAGADIKNFVEMDSKAAYRFATEGHDVMNAIASYDLPVIAAIHGYALGGGFELALACDIRIAAPETKMGLPEINLGVLPGFGGTQRLKELVGEGKALEIISTGKRMSADEALKYGIIQEISENYLNDACKLAEELAEKPLISLGFIKNLIRRQPDEIFEYEKEMFAKLFDTEDKREGISAFLEKRKPEFKGK